MRKNSLLYVGLALSFILLSLHLFAFSFYLYWTVFWYDFLMHFLGGLTFGVLAVWFFKIEIRSSRALFLVLFWVLVPSLVWEVFEYLNDISVTTENYTIDTTIDFVMDTLGALAAYWWATLRSR